MQDTKNSEINNAIVFLQNLDLDAIASVFRAILVYYASSKLTQGAIVQIDYRLPKYKKVKMPPELVLESSAFEINEKIKKEDKGMILNFVNTLYSEFPIECLILLCNNLKTLKIRDTNNKNRFFKSFVTGTYDVKKNEVELRDCSFGSPMYHELFHLSSSVIQNKIRFSGFSQDSLGNGINEGYTQLLTERYFPNDTDVNTVYPIQKRIMQAIEMIIGQKTMGQLYLQANLKGFIENMKSYASEEAIMKFVSDVDFISDYLINPKVVPFKKNLLHKAFNSISEFLIKVIVNYLVLQAFTGNIDEEELNRILMSFLNILGFTININGEYYTLLNQENLYSILQKNLHTPKSR